MTFRPLPPWLEWLFQPAPYTDAPWIALLALIVGLLVLALVTIFIGVPRFRAWWNDDTPRPGEDERGVSTDELTLMEHLLELRSRLVRSVIALAAATAGAAVFYRLWFEIAVRPIRGRGNCGPGNTAISPEELCLQAITPTELIFAYFKVTLVVGLILSMPIIAYQLWAFIAPGMTRQERKYVVAVVPGATASFIAGLLFAYFVLLPPALGFLLGFGDVLVMPTVDSYISFVTRLTVAIGVVFQLPLVLFFLAKVRLINAKMLGSIRRYVIVAAFVVAAIVTPTPDPFNQILVVVPILVLYEFGALLTRFA